MKIPVTELRSNLSHSCLFFAIIITMGGTYNNVSYQPIETGSTLLSINKRVPTMDGESSIPGIALRS